MFGFQPFDPEDALPPEQVRFTEVRVEPWPEDNHRVRVHIGITPFEKRPNLDSVITDQNGEEVASISIIEAMELKLVFTMHLRIPEITGSYTLTASLSYEDLNTVDERSINFELQDNAGAQA